MTIVFLLYLCMASTFTIGKLALAYVHPFFLIATRMLSAGFLLLGVQYWYTRRFHIPYAHWGLFLQLALFHIYCAFMPEFWALQYLSGAQACLIYSLSPFVTAVLSYYLFGKGLTRMQLYGLLIGFVPMLYGQQNQVNYFLSLPQAALLVSVCSASYGWLLLRKISVDLGYALTFANGVAMLLGGFFAAMTTALIPGGFTISPMYASSSVLGTWLIATVGPFTAGLYMFLGYTAALILVANMLFYNVYGYLLSRFSATFLSFAGFTTPLFAAFFDWLFWGTIPPLTFFATFCMVGIGLYVFYKDELVSIK